LFGELLENIFEISQKTFPGIPVGIDYLDSAPLGSYAFDFKINDFHHPVVINLKARLWQWVFCVYIVNDWSII